MRKISKTRASSFGSNNDLLETRPIGIAGATITSRPASLDIDFDMLFARGKQGATVTGAAQADPVSAVPAKNGTVSLSDGTRITFATASQFEIVELV